MTTTKPKRPGPAPEARTKRKTPRQDQEALFVLHYLACFNQAEAARRAGFSAKTAKESGYQVMQRPSVKVAIEEGLRAIAEKLEVTAQSVLWDIHRIATKAETEGDFSAALKGRELLGKYLKLFTEKHEHGGIGGGPVQLQITREEAGL